MTKYYKFIKSQNEAFIGRLPVIEEETEKQTEQTSGKCLYSLRPEHIVHPDDEKLDPPDSFWRKLE